MSYVFQMKICDILLIYCPNIDFRTCNAIFHDSLNSSFETNICHILLICGPNIDCGCLLEPQGGGSNKYPRSMF